MPSDAPPARERRSLRSRFRDRVARLFDRLHDLAEAGWATTAVATWNLLQGSVMPGPVEALFIPLGLADPPRVWRFAAGALVGSLAGAAIAYAIGAHAFETVGLRVLGLAGMDAGEIEKMRVVFSRHGWTLVFLSTLTPVSTKLMSIAAGAFGVPFAPFMGGIAVGRAVRFVALAVVIRFAGHRLERWIHPRGDRRRP